MVHGQTDAAVRFCRMFSGTPPHNEKSSHARILHYMVRSCKIMQNVYAQPYRRGSRPLKLSQFVPRADLMPKCVHTNIARHVYRRCTPPFYLCQPMTFSWPLLRADTGVVRWCTHTPTALHTHTHTCIFWTCLQEFPSFLSPPLSLSRSLSHSLTPGSKKKKCLILYKCAVTLCHCTLGERDRRCVCFVNGAWLCNLSCYDVTSCKSEWTHMNRKMLALFQLWGQRDPPARQPTARSYFLRFRLFAFLHLFPLSSFVLNTTATTIFYHNLFVSVISSRCFCLSVCVCVFVCCWVTAFLFQNTLESRWEIGQVCMF